jgi:hypothetical protein
MQRHILWENREASTLVWRNPIINLSNVEDTTRRWVHKILLFAAYCVTWSSNTCCLRGREGERSAANFMLKLSCFCFCKWLLSIQDVEIRQCTVTACSTPRRFSTGTAREMQTILGKGQAELECNSVLSENWPAHVLMLLSVLTVLIYQYSTRELDGATGNASRSTDSINIAVLYQRTSWCNRKCFSL